MAIKTFEDGTAITDSWKNALHNNRNYTFEALIYVPDPVLANTVEAVNVTAEDIMRGSVKYEDVTSDSSSFGIGTTIINRISFSLNNFDGKFDEYDFEGCQMRPKIALVIEGEENPKYIAKSSYTITEYRNLGSVVTISAEDDLRYFDRPADFSSLTFPCSLNVIVAEAAAQCDGTAIDSKPLGDFGDEYKVSSAPEGTMTWREVIGYAAQICCKNARISHDWKLVFTWYEPKGYNEVVQEDGTVVNEPAYEVIDSLASQDISNNDVTIAGVIVSSYDSEDALSPISFPENLGDKDYILYVQNNPFIESGKASVVANHIGPIIEGITFRPMTISALSDPTIEAGDIVQVVDKKGKTHVTYLTSCNFTMGSYETFACAVPSQEQQSTTRYTDQEKQTQDYTKKFSVVNKRLERLEGAFVQDLVMDVDTFVVYFADGTVKTYVYTVNDAGLITNITLMG